MSRHTHAHHIPLYIHCMLTYSLCTYLLNTYLHTFQSGSNLRQDMVRGLQEGHDREGSVKVECWKRFLVVLCGSLHFPDYYMVYFCTLLRPRDRHPSFCKVKITSNFKCFKKYSTLAPESPTGFQQNGCLFGGWHGIVIFRFKSTRTPRPKSNHGSESSVAAGMCLEDTELYKHIIRGRSFVEQTLDCCASPLYRHGVRGNALVHSFGMWKLMFVNMTHVILLQ